MPGAVHQRSDVPAGVALSRLEGRADSVVWQLAGRLLASFRQRRRQRPAAAATVAHFAAHSGATPLELVAALGRALGDGALESSRGLLERLVLVLTHDSGALPDEAHALVSEALVVLGDRSRALDLARQYRPQLLRTARGVSMLEVLGLPAPSPFLPDRRPNMLQLSRRVASGGLTPEELASLLQGRPWLPLQFPELNLLFFVALKERDPERALRFLNRFLAVHGRTLCTWKRACSRQDNLLACLAFEPEPPIAGGPLVSVLVPVYRARATVSYAIDSLLAQSYQNIEILACDDASGDGTLEVLKERYGRHDRVRLFRSLSNQGAYNVRNALAVRAGGDLLTFHDADDLALPGRIAKQARRLGAGRFVACVTRLVRFTSEGAPVFHSDQSATRLCPVSMMLPRQVFQSVGPFRAARVGADREFLAELSAHFRPSAICRLRAPEVFALRAPGSATTSAGTESWEDGYRSSARRIYSELICARHALGGPAPSDEAVNDALRASGNWAEPSQIEPVS